MAIIVIKIIQMRLKQSIKNIEKLVIKKLAKRVSYENNYVIIIGQKAKGLIHVFFK